MARITSRDNKRFVSHRFCHCARPSLRCSGTRRFKFFGDLFWCMRTRCGWPAFSPLWAFRLGAGRDSRQRVFMSMNRNEESSLSRLPCITSVPSRLGSVMFSLGSAVWEELAPRLRDSCVLWLFWNFDSMMLSGILLGTHRFVRVYGCLNA